MNIATLAIKPDSFLSAVCSQSNFLDPAYKVATGAFAQKWCRFEANLQSAGRNAIFKIDWWE